MCSRCLWKPVRALTHCIAAALLPKVISFARGCALLLVAVAIPVGAHVAVDGIQDAKLRKLAEEYIDQVNQAAEVENHGKGLVGVLDSEDRLLHQAKAGSKDDQATIGNIVANGRLRLDYRNPVDFAEMAIKANVPDAALLALDLGRIPKAMELSKRPGGNTSSTARRTIYAARSIMLADTPPRKCKARDAGLCDSLYDLLALPPLGYTMGRMRDIENFAERTATDSSSPMSNESDFAQFLLSDFPQAVKRPPHLTITTRGWKTAIIPSGAGADLAAVFRASAQRGQPEAARVIEAILARPELRTLVGTDASLVDGATRKQGQDDPANIGFLTLQNAFSIGDRHFLVMKVDAGLNASIAMIEVTAQRPDRVRYWRGEVKAGGLTISPAPLLGASHPFFIVAKTETSAGYLTLWLVNPVTLRTTQVFDEEEAYHGTFFTANLTGDGRYHLLVSRSTGDRRYGDCNQCPSRVESLIFRMSADGTQPRLVGKQVSWGDIGSGTNANMFGLGPEVARQNLSSEIEASMSTLSASDMGDDEYANLAKSVVALIAELNYSEAHAEAAATCLRMLALLGSNVRNFADSADVILALRLIAADAYLQTGNVPAAADQLDGASLSAVQNPALKDYFTQVRLNVARASGGLSRHYEVLQSVLTEQPNAASARRHLADYLLQVGSDEEALAVSRKASDARVREQSYWLWDLYPALRAQVNLGRYDEALTSVALLLRGSAIMRSSSLSARALLTAAEIARRTQNFDVAQRLFNAGLARMDSAAWVEEGPAALLLYSRLLRRDAAPRKSLQVLKTAMHLVNRTSPMFAALQDEMASVLETHGQASAALSASAVAFDAILRQQTTVVEERYKLSFVSSNAEIAERHISRLLRSKDTKVPALVDAVERWHAQVLRSMRQEHRTQVGIDRSPAAVVSEIARGDVAYVSYYLAGSRQVALVAERGLFRVVPLNLDAAALERARHVVRSLTDIGVSEVRQAVWLDRTPPALKSELAFLHDRLIGDLNLNSQIKTVVTVPDERLYWVPWPALASAGEGKQRTLFESVTVLVTPSVLMLAGAPPDTSRVRYLALGTADPIPSSLIKAALPEMFVDADPPALPELRSARVEISDIGVTLSRRFDGTAKLMSDNSTTSSPNTVNMVLSDMSEAEIVHVAAHGIFNSRNPMSSAIFLSGSDESAVLRPSQLASANLKSVSLLTLSACQTGMSDVRRGAEAIGFVRGAMVGGARRVMLANWVVEDRATQKFFEEFYARIGNGQTFVDAYRDAVIKLSGQYEHPFYWAGYTMYSAVLP